MKLYMPTPLMNCLEVTQVKDQSDVPHCFAKDVQKRRALIGGEIEQVRFREAESLRHLLAGSIQCNMLG